MKTYIQLEHGVVVCTRVDYRKYNNTPLSNEIEIDNPEKYLGMIMNDDGSFTQNDNFATDLRIDELKKRISNFNLCGIPCTEEQAELKQLLGL